MTLEVKGLTKHYERAGTEFAAVSAVDLALEKGEFVCITGHSGSGKSTLLSIIAGLLRPDEGTVLLNGEDLTAYDDKALSQARNTKIGYIPQGHSILASLSVLDNVRLPFYLYRREGDSTQRAQTLLEQMGIAHLAQQQPSQLSGGELRRVSIARGLINNPELLLADEPTGDLDPESSETVMALFSEVAKQGTSVLVVTHEQENLRYATRHLTMLSGALSQSS